MRSTTLLAAGLFAWTLMGCSGGTPSISDSGHGASTANMPLARGDGFSKEELDARALEQVWTTRVAGSIDQIWFLEDDIYFTSTESGGSYLIKVGGDDGLVRWTYGLKDELRFPPCVFRYPADLRATRHTEVFIVQNDDIVCLDDTYGDKVYEIGCDFSISTPLSVSTENVYVGSFTGRVFAMNKGKRFQEWTYLTDAPVTAAGAIGKGSIYFGSEDRKVYSFELGDGFNTDEGWIISTGGRIVATPLFYYDRIFVGSFDYKVYCLEEFQGQVRWGTPVGAPVVSSPFPFKQDIFVVTLDEKTNRKSWKVVSLDYRDGNVGWERAGMTKVLAAEPLYCFAVDTDAQINALRIDDGKTDWSLDVSGFDYVFGQDARRGAKKDMWGTMFVANRDGFIQSFRSRR